MRFLEDRLPAMACVRQYLALAPLEAFGLQKVFAR